MIDVYTDTLECSIINDKNNYKYCIYPECTQDYRTDTGVYKTPMT